MVAKGRGLEDCLKKVKGLRSTNWWLQNSHRDIKYSIGNIVNNIAITTVVPGGCLKYWGKRFVKYMGV